mmetsp:Transcript_1079/g.1059  ORF Transcript_1079/g.1059 Transcript_1079/m.1059 type:complete len:114 (+) Transcript_1079:36-377(+)
MKLGVSMHQYDYVEEFPNMKSRTTEYESRRANKVIKKKNSFPLKEQQPKKPTEQRRMKSEERTTSIYLNPGTKNKKNAKVTHEKSVSNRINVKQEFDDYIQSNTSRKPKPNPK